MYSGCWFLGFVSVSDLVLQQTCEVHGLWPSLHRWVDGWRLGEVKVSSGHRQSHLQWQWCLCFHLLSQTMSHSLWQVGHCITLPTLSEGNSHISKSGTLIHPLWPGLEMGKNSVWEVCKELWRDKTVSFFGLNVTWDFILSLLLGPRIWPGLSPDPYTMSCDMACFYCWS